MQECRITITLFEAEREALYTLARLERRDTRGQAAFLVRQELQRRGLLNETDRSANKPPAREVAAADGVRLQPQRN